MNVLIITGMSGAGKTLAIRSLEDIGYYCVDNMPPALIVKFVELFLKSDPQKDKIAMVMDIRSGGFINDLLPMLDELAELDVTYNILFLEASDRALINRFKESRRMHPLARSGDIQEAIDEERSKLEVIKKRADYVVDTTDMSARELKFKLTGIFYGSSDKGMMVNIISFGFKNGLPPTCDLVFDVRFLPNPFYIEELKYLNGLNEEVSSYVKESADYKIFIEKLFDMIDFLLPKYVDEGKSMLVIGIGCTGGKHRSVTIAETLKEHIQAQNYDVNIDHRDILVDKK